MSLSPDVLSALWDRACACEIGIKVSISMDRERFRTMMYNHRKTNPNPRWDQIMMFLPNDGKIWLVKKTTEMPE